VVVLSRQPSTRPWRVVGWDGATLWMLEIGAVFMQTETELMLKSRRVVSGRLLDHGFVFRYPLWADAALDLCRQWKLAHQRPLNAA
jgi:hypothetical protein